MNVALTNLHLVLQSSHVSLLHQFVERYELPEALRHSHDLSFFGEVERQLESRVQPHLPNTATHTTGFQSSFLFYLIYCTMYHTAGIWLNVKTKQTSFNRPDQLKDVLDEAGAIIAAQGCVVVLQQFDNGVPPVTCVVDHVVAAHVNIELNPVYFLRQVQNVCMDEEYRHS